MPQIPFQHNLINAVISGRKPFTVRQLRKKNPVKPGDKLHIYTGSRTKQAFKHCEHICCGVLPIKVDFKNKQVYIDNVILDPLIKHWFTTTDIQGTEDEFFDFFKKMKYKRPLVLIIYNHKVFELIGDYLFDKYRTEKKMRENSNTKP